MPLSVRRSLFPLPLTLALLGGAAAAQEPTPDLQSHLEVLAWPDTGARDRLRHLCELALMNGSTGGGTTDDEPIGATSEQRLTSGLSAVIAWSQGASVLDVDIREDPDVGCDGGPQA